MHFYHYINYINACNKFSSCVFALYIIRVKKLKKYPCEPVVSDLIFKKDFFKPYKGGLQTSAHMALNLYRGDLHLNLGTINIYKPS